MSSYVVSFEPVQTLGAPFGVFEQSTIRKMIREYSRTHNKFRYMLTKYNEVVVSTSIRRHLTLLGDAPADDPAYNNATDMYFNIQLFRYLPGDERAESSGKIRCVVNHISGEYQIVRMIETTYRSL